MEKVFLLRGLNCPNCAAKIEKEVGELEGVHEATINLMKESLTVQLDADSVAAIVKQVETVVHSHEPEVAVSACDAGAKASPEGAEAQDHDGRKTVFRLILGAALLALGVF